MFILPFQEKLQQGVGWEGLIFWFVFPSHGNVVLTTGLDDHEGLFLIQMILGVPDSWIKTKFTFHQLCLFSLHAFSIICFSHRKYVHWNQKAA